MRFATILCLALASAPVFAAETVPAHELIFKPGTIDRIGPEAELIYDRETRNARLPDAADRDTGRVVLSFDPPGQDGIVSANLDFRKEDADRSLGSFPASIGNPIIMYFYEVTARDMSETAGGSPFYIRNRMKEALLDEVEIVRDTIRRDGREIDVQRVTLRPFADDPNRDRMQGFGALEMTVTMSDDIPGWYLSMVSEAVPESGGDPVYRSALRFDRLDTGDGE